MQILAIRHAPTLWNEEKRLQGRTDLSLSEKGRARAENWRLRDDWQGCPLYVSPLKRAKETALLAFPGRVTIVEPRLIEMDFGSWEGQRLDDARRLDPMTAAREADGLDFRAPLGESPREVQTRLLDLLPELRRDAIFVTHKAVIRALYSLATGWNMLGKQPHRFEEDCARLFLWENAKLELLEANFSLIDRDLSTS